MGSKNTRVVLQRGIRRCGDLGDVVSVRRGYARYLVECLNWADWGTKEAIKSVEEKKAQLKQEEDKRQQQAKQTKQIVDDLLIVVVCPAGDDGQLYRSVRAQDIIDAIKKQNVKAEIDTKMVSIKSHVKCVGIYQARLQLSGKVFSDISFNVVATDQEERELRKPKTEEVSDASTD